MLTNLSLEKSAKEYTDIEKLDTLDYDSKIRTPLTKLSQNELKYCEYDIKCLYKVICYYRDKYGGHVGKIPLTATSEVRKELQKHVDYFYMRKMWDLVPTPKMYLRFMACFQGGYTHANILNTNRVFENVKSYDIASSYPTVMCLEKYPYTPFMFIDYDDYMEMKKHDNRYAFMFKLKLKNIKSKFYNNYISHARCEYVNDNDLIYDNGRINKCKELILWCTDVDKEIIELNYDIQEMEYIEIYYAEKDYLDIRVIQFILELYGNKQKLKGVSDKVDLYKKSKAYINSLY